MAEVKIVPYWQTQEYRAKVNVRREAIRKTAGSGFVSGSRLKVR